MFIDGWEFQELENEHTTLRDILNSDDGQWLWEDLQLTGEEEWVAQEIMQGTAIIISDGSFQPILTRELGTASWHCYGMESNRLCRGSLRATMDKWASAYRSELLGIYGALYFILGICQHHRIQTGKIKLGCDSDGALLVSEPDMARVPIRYKQSDVV